jgi:hypothetical protein
MMKSLCGIFVKQVDKWSERRDSNPRPLSPQNTAHSQAFDFSRVTGTNLHVPFVIGSRQSLRKLCETTPMAHPCQGSDRLNSRTLSVISDDLNHVSFNIGSLAIMGNLGRITRSYGLRESGAPCILGAVS